MSLSRWHDPAIIEPIMYIWCNLKGKLGIFDSDVHANSQAWLASEASIYRGNGFLV